MNGFTEEQLAELIAGLPPAPAAWVQAASELPPAREAIDRIVEQAMNEHALREAVIADLEDALRCAGVPPSPEMVQRLRDRLRAF